MDEQSDRYPLSLDPYEVHGYQGVLQFSCCPTCRSKLNWARFNSQHSQDDRFCVASCCGIQYHMVPEKVRVLSLAEAELKNIESERIMADDEFLQALRDMGDSGLMKTSGDFSGF